MGKFSFVACFKDHLIHQVFPDFWWRKGDYVPITCHFFFHKYFVSYVQRFPSKGLIALSKESYRCLFWRLWKQEIEKKWVAHSKVRQTCRFPLIGIFFLWPQELKSAFKKISVLSSWNLGAIYLNCTPRIIPIGSW